MRTQISAKRNGLVSVNGAQLYHEVRGDGPSILFISGATGDAGHFEKVADLLSDEFTVVTFDRRGNSRSPRPVGWQATSIDEQADDAAGLLQTLGLAPAAVFGSSGGAVILLNLIARRPEVLRGSIVHEPPLIQVLADPQGTMAVFQAIAEREMARGGPRGAMEAFLRLEAGDKVFESLSHDLRERMLGNAERFFSMEMQPLSSFVPDAAALASVQVPVRVLASSENRGDYHWEASQWVAGRLGTKLDEIPGGHAAYMDRPVEVVEVIRPFLRGMR